MSFEVNWDIDKYKEEHESDEQWQLRRNFMECWKQSYPEERLVCLARVFANIEFMGCRYPQEVMQEVARMSKEVNKQLTYSEYGGNLPVIANVTSLAQGYTTAEYLMDKNTEETTQQSVSLSMPVGTDSFAIGPSNQVHGEMQGQYSPSVMQGPVSIPELLRTSHTHTYETIPNQKAANDNVTGIGKPSDMLQQSYYSNSIHQNVVNRPLWQSRDPRIQAYGGIQNKTNMSQQGGLQCSNLQANQDSVFAGTPNVHQNELASHSTQVNAQSSNSNTMPENIPLDQDQIIGSNNDKSSDEQLEVANVTTSSSGQSTLPQQITSKNFTPQSYGPFQNSNKAVSWSYPNINPILVKQKKKKGKCKIVVGGNLIKGPMARRYAYWIQAGKTQTEAEHLCRIHMKNIPEYKELKEKLGSVCQLKRLNGDIIPTFKKKVPNPKLKKKRKEKTSKQRKKYLFWIKFGKTEDEARMLSQKAYSDIPLAQELMARALEKGTKNWNQWALQQQSINAKTIEAKTMNPTQLKIQASTATNEDSDIIEITTVVPDTIVISDDDENDKVLATRIAENSPKTKIEKELQNKRFHWWMNQGKSKEDATVLSQTPMAISDALNHILDPKTMECKELQEKNQMLDVRKTQSRMDHALKTNDNSDAMNEIQEDTEIIDKAQQEKWLAFKAIEDQRIKSQTFTATQGNPMIANLNLQHGYDTASNTGKNPVTSDENNELKIYIQEVNSRIGFKEALLVRDSIAQCICDEGMSMPCFGLLHDTFVVICNDEESRDCLDKQIPTLEPWKGARLKIIDNINEKFKFAVYARFFIPAHSESGLHKNSKPKDVLKELHQQNPKIDCTTDWFILDMQVTDKGRLLVVRFDNKAYEALKSVGYRLSWYSQPIKVKLNNKGLMKYVKKFNFVTIDPPSNKEPGKKVLTIMPQAENSIVGCSYVAEKTIVPMISGSTICNEETISNEQACSTEGMIIPQLENLAQPSTSTEQHSQSTYRSSVMVNDLRRKVGKSSRFWGIDTPRLLPGHRIAITLQTDLQGNFDRTDDASCEARYHKEVRPFSEQDEEYSLEERVAARRQNSSHAVFDEQTCYRPHSVLAKRAQEYSRAERVFDKQDSKKNRVIQGFPYEEQEVLAEQSQENYNDRVFAGRSEKYSRENRFSNSQENYGMTRSDDADTEYSRNYRVFGERIQECSRGRFDEQDGKRPWEDSRVIQDSPQKERVSAGERQDYPKEKSISTGKSKEYSEENRFPDRQSPVNTEGSRYEERDARYAKNYRVVVGRCQEYSRDVFDEYAGKQSCQDSIIPNSQDELVLARQSQYSVEDRDFVGRSQEYSEENRLFEKRIPENGRDRFYERDDNILAEQVFDEQEKIVIQDYPDEERAWAGKSQECSKHDSVCDGQSQELLEKKNRFSDSRSSESSGKRRFDERDTGYSRNYGVYEQHPRELLHEHEENSSWKAAVIQGSPQEERFLSEQGKQNFRKDRKFDGQHREYSENRYSDRRSPETSWRNTFLDRRSPENSVNGRFDDRDAYKRDRVFDRRDQEYGQESGLTEGFQEYSRETSGKSISQKDKYFSERNEYSRRDRNFDDRHEYFSGTMNTRRDQNYASNNRDRQRHQTGSRVHNIYHSQTSNRPYMDRHEDEWEDGRRTRDRRRKKRT